MKQIILLSFLCLYAGVQPQAQELSCKDFQKGNFYIDGYGGYTIHVRRKKNEQIEYGERNGTSFKKYEIIKWIDDCTYRLTYNASKMTLDEHEKMINSLGGVVVTVLKIEGKCMYYRSTLTVNGEEKHLTSKICKD